MTQRKAPAKSRKTAKPTSAHRVKPVTTADELSFREPSLSFPVVAIGASAGGLAAFTALLKALPSKTGMAFVLIQHLEPSHESALASILSKATSMAVVEVSDGIQVEPNHVYVIPPNTRMTIRGGALKLAPRSEISGMQRPIDDFAAALAEEQGPAAIGVLLSGTGSDGTVGLKAIKAAGGITFAEDPKSAQWPAMPVSAITAGAVDFVLSPKRIAAELTRIGRHPYVAEPAVVPDGDELEKICLILRSITGIDFRLYKQPTFRRRVARRMALQQITSLEQYAETLKQNKEEAHALADDIFIHVTSFFRNPECFQALRRRVMSKWRGRKPNGQTLRIWTPGCSTGEEVYSLAMLLLEELGAEGSRFKIQFFGTDIEETAVEHARAGVYSETAVAGVSPVRLNRFFIKTDQGYQIQTFVRDLCVFSRHDLAKDPPFSRLDLISCRNVLIYMGPALQKRVLSVFQYALKPGGVLFLGNSESISGFSDVFTPDDRKHRIFMRKPALGGFRDLGEAPLYVAPSAPAPARPVTPDAADELRKEAERLLLQHHVPPAVIVDSDLHIVHIQGDTSPFLTPSSGQPSFHLLKMVRPELVVDLRAAIASARKSGHAVQKDDVALTLKGQPALIGLEVRPFRRRDGAKQHLLIVFQKAEPVPADNAGSTGTLSVRKSAKLDQIERELKSARLQLRALITDNETVQEEMKAASEEILSSNEELQSTNEELESAKEELQSSNEELISLNEELQHRNSELSVLSTDLNSLLVNLDIPVLVLDAALRVRRFTPMAGELFNLIPGDVGRPFSNIASNLDITDWDELLAAVTFRGRPVEREVTDRQGRRYSLRLRPHKPNGAEVDGVVMFLIDVDTIHHALREAQESRDLAHAQELRTGSILNSLTAHVAVISPDGKIVATNDAWKLFARENGNPPLEMVAEGANYLQTCSQAFACSADALAAFEGIRDVLKGDRSAFQLEYPCDSPEKRRWFYMNATPLKDGRGGAVIAHIDITQRKIAEEAAVKSEATIRALLESSPQSVVAVTPSDEIVMINGNTEKMFGYAKEELLGQSLSILVPEASRERHVAHHQNYFKDMDSRPMGLGMTLEGRRKDGSTFPVEIGLNGMETGAGKVAVAFVSDITRRRELEQAAETHAKEVQALAASLLTAQEEERRRVSRELHDQVCQQLASLAFDIGDLVASPVSSEQSKGKLKDLQTRVVRASEETRHLAYDLHPSVLDDLGLIVSLRELCADFSKRSTHTAVEFQAEAISVPIPRELGSCFYRVAQESLHNIFKHADAGHVSVILVFRDGTLVLTIADDGVGFDPKTVKGRGGLGLISMEERVRLVHGRLSITSRTGEGSRVSLSAPLPA